MSSQLSQVSISNHSNQRIDATIGEMPRGSASLGYQCNNSSQGWLRGQFLKAFRKTKNRPKLAASSNNNPLDHHHQHHLANGHHQGLPESQLNQQQYYIDPELVKELTRQLAEKDALLQQVQLDSINNQDQVETLKEIINQMRQEIDTLKAQNERLQKCVNRESNVNSGRLKPLNGSEFGNTAATTTHSNPVASSSTTTPVTRQMCMIRVGGQFIGTLAIMPTTTWEQLDESIVDTFNNYYTNSLNVNCIDYYLVGIERVKRVLFDYRNHPELMPYGYVVEDNIILIILQDNGL